MSNIDIDDLRAGDVRLQSGMNLRDWFAGQALAVLIGADPLIGVGPNVAYHCEQIGPERGPATLAYKYADAMLASRLSHPVGEVGEGVS